MEKQIFDESNSLWYERRGDLYYPDFALSQEEGQPIGRWGRQHLEYIKKYRTILYNSLVLSDELNGYLADVDQQAQGMLDDLIQQMAKSRGATEDLKAADLMAWVGKMNNIRAAAEECVHAKIIYTLD